MTPDDLEALVLEPGDFWPLQRALAPLDEKARAKLSGHARKLYSQLNSATVDPAASERMKAFLATRETKSWGFWHTDASRCAALALFGLCPLSTLTKGHIYAFHLTGPVFERVVANRRPDWLDAWIAHTLEDTVPGVEFPTLRSWITAGVCQKPEVDGYYRLFAMHLMRTPRHNSDEVVPPLSRQLLDDPELLADIGGLFRVETLAFNTNPWLTNNAPAGYETWPDALVRLTAEGHLDRGHLLAQALSGLRLDLKQNQLAGYHGVYRRMSPTRDERLRHQPDYVELLCHPVGHVVKFALEMLGDLDKEGALDAGAVLRELSGVLSGASKGNASAALKLTGRIIARGDADAGPALTTATEGLRNAAADVQGQALTLIEKHAAALTPDHLDLLAEMQAFVAASNRHRLAALTAVRETPAPVATEPEEAYATLPGGINAQKVLSDTDRIVPIATLDALIDAVLHAVEVVNSPDEVERIIDAIARLAGERPADFAERTAPLVHRLKSRHADGKGIVAGGSGIASAVWNLLWTWLRGQRNDAPGPLERNETLCEGFYPLTMHLSWLMQRVADGRATQLLSAPTHTGGWIDPLVWVERLKQAPQQDTMDLRLSLLRLAPDHRAEALARISDVPDGLRRIATFALGGDETLRKSDRDWHAAWISAARCRAPDKDWRADFAALNLDDGWADSLTPARYTWRASHRKDSYQGQTWKHPEFELSAEGAGDAPAGAVAGLIKAVTGRITTDFADMPSAALAMGLEQIRRWYQQQELNTVWLTRWLAFVWPQNPAAVHMRAARRLALNSDQNGSGWEPRFGFFHALFQKHRPWGEAGHLLLCLGLAARDADVKGLAVDALIEGIDGRLFDPELFAGVAVRVAAGEWLKLNRMGDSLMTVVRVSSGHAAVIGRAVQAWLPDFDPTQTNGFALFEVLLEVQAVTGAALTPDARAALGRVAGSGKAAKLARQILAR